MAGPQDMILPLREMRAENAARHGEVLKRFDPIRRRPDSLEDAWKPFRRALAADSLPSRLATGGFGKRIEALAKKVPELEAHG